MRQLEEENPTIARVIQMGRTERGVDIFALRIVLEEHLESETLPVVLVSAAAVARDWIAAMSAVDIMHMLVEHYHTYGAIVDDLEWFIIPVANPDGYIFSMEADEVRNCDVIVCHVLKQL
jgi:murein tripeptide amidase MpaA